MVVERLISPRSRLTASRENDAGGFRKYSSRNRAFSPRDKFTPPKGGFFPPREKIVDNFTSSREKVGEGHVPPVTRVFPEGGPNSPRYIMMSPWDKFTSPKDMVRNKHVSFKGEGCRDGKTCEVYHSS